ncbi:MAG: MBOAT family O-acyltransferase [Thermoguttaceae bacterium]|jgi:D-alanyl-lipoteichoic acid acyltransferase DltB (MBOAT superfamily)|nr:MBOAT family O-acyltransferase [Thermoguttaceae bacterium]
MLFNSYTFWIFFLAVFLLYRLLGHRWQNRLLLVASYVFYGAWDWRFLSLIWISTCIDYLVGLKLGNHSTSGAGVGRKAWLALSVCANLGLLGFFKYYGFFAEEMVGLLTWLGFSASLPSLQIILPVGISFYTFQTMSYTIDVYRRQIEPTRDLEAFALYVAFFPQLVAGPIERSTHLMPQVLKPRRLKPGDFTEGLYLVAIGMFKKVVIADNMAEIVNAVFQSPVSELSGLDCLVGVYAFAFQIYGDFSGYSAIARGVAKWLGFDIMVNFNLPYFAQSPREFWHRWHISLSTWLRDYLYIPLGGSRNGTVTTYRNLMLTMLLGGLWHGAGWTFICWGLFHGVLLCADRAFGLTPSTADRRSGPWWCSILNVAITFHLVCLGWLLFRAESIGQAWSMLYLICTNHQMTVFAQFGLAMVAFYTLPLLAYELWLLLSNDRNKLLKVAWPVRAAVYSYVALMLVFFHPVVKHEFIYFQF